MAHLVWNDRLWWGHFIHMNVHKLFENALMSAIYLGYA